VYNGQGQHTTPGGRRYQFPIILHQLLCECPNEIASFSPFGHSFQILDAQRLVDEVLPHYSQQTKFSSFSRQLQIYGFRKADQERRNLVSPRALAARSFPSFSRTCVAWDTIGTRRWHLRTIYVASNCWYHDGKSFFCDSKAFLLEYGGVCRRLLLLAAPSCWMLL